MSVSGDDAKPPWRNQPEPLALELTCPICLLLFSDPVSLPCGHIYCFACLEKMGAGLDQHCCPECQAEYRGTRSLVKNFKVRSIVETYRATAGNVSSTMRQSDVSYVTFKSNASSVAEETEANDHQHIEKAKQSQKENSGCPLKDLEECKGKDGFQIGSGCTDEPFSLDKKQGNAKAKSEMDEPKFRLASQVTELTLKLEMAEGVLKKEKEWQLEVNAANTQLRERAAKLLEQIIDMSLSYSADVTKLIEEELGPGEAGICSRVSLASELSEQLRQTVNRAESLLTEPDGTVFSEELQILRPQIEELMAKPLKEEEDLVESKINPVQACSKLEQMNAELRKGFGEIQRSLRGILNPSEVTFDPETAHPNLVLSDDLKTVTFSPTKQPYPPSPQRFSSFFQVLSSQTFYGGDHCWVVELEGSPWIIGVCYGGKLARSGLPSALESSHNSWCLMWHDNLLTAFERGHGVPLKRTTASRRLEIRLSFKTHRLSFYNVSPSSGKTHVYTFKANLTEPVHLAYRMMSGQAKARATIGA
ncbi:E3 ubiquitin-protein ligase TRIM39 [Myripristis murdjan]|uniref:E3 ubiquitin-protein ligase TRIM39 n=1 Tax=Myripristis murdjan TaxID=586833 RepID=UPI0011764795|nr:E3 ubiquitin-protein ligase TRIM39-like [Myripristis murdjan]